MPMHDSSQTDERPTTDTATAADDLPPDALAGRRIAITRPPEQAAALAERLEALGATVVPLAAIAIAPLDPGDDPAAVAAFDDALRRMATYDWLVLTSANGVRAVRDRLDALGLGWDARGAARVATIGPATATALAEQGVPADLVPEEYVAEGIVAALAARGEVAGRRLLLLRADIAREALVRDLRAAGAHADDVAAYRTVVRAIPPEEVRAALLDVRPDAVTFTSSSTVRGLLDGLRATGADPAEALRGVALAAIGPVTAATLRDYGFAPSIVAEEYTIPGLVRALADHFAGAVTA